MLSNASIQAFLPTTDFDRARAFFEGVLGLQYIKNDGHALVMDSNGTMIRVSKVQPDFKPQQFTILGWEVADIESAVADLEARGVTFERYGFFVQDDHGIWTAPTGDRVAWFKDPDGNTLSVSQHV